MIMRELNARFSLMFLSNL